VGAARFLADAGVAVGGGDVRSPPDGPSGRGGIAGGGPACGRAREAVGGRAAVSISDAPQCLNVRGTEKLVGGRSSRTPTPLAARPARTAWRSTSRNALNSDEGARARARAIGLPSKTSFLRLSPAVSRAATLGALAGGVALTAAVAYLRVVVGEPLRLGRDADGATVWLTPRDVVGARAAAARARADASPGDATAARLAEVWELEAARLDAAAGGPPPPPPRADDLRV